MDSLLQISQLLQVLWDGYSVLGRRELYFGFVSLLDFLHVMVWLAGPSREVL